MKHPLVIKLGQKLLPEFDEIAEKIRRAFERVNVNVSGTTVGSLTQYEGYSYFIDCIIEDASSDEPDNIALCVNLGHLTTRPRIDGVVCWGHPSGYAEASFRNYSGSFPDKNSILVSDKILAELYQDLPRLYEALFDSLERRKPPNEC